MTIWESKQATLHDIDEKAKLIREEFDGKISLMRDELKLLAANEAREATKQWTQIAINTAMLMLIVIGGIVGLLTFIVNVAIRK